MSVHNSLLMQVGEKFISNIKSCIGEATGVHSSLKVNSRCAGCSATAEVLSLIRAMEKMKVEA